MTALVQFVDLLKAGAYAGVLGFLLGIANLLMLVVLLGRIPPRRF